MYDELEELGIGVKGSKPPKEPLVELTDEDNLILDILQKYEIRQHGAKYVLWFRDKPVDKTAIIKEIGKSVSLDQFAIHDRLEQKLYEVKFSQKSEKKEAVGSAVVEISSGFNKFEILLEKLLKRCILYYVDGQILVYPKVFTDKVKGDYDKTKQLGPCFLPKVLKNKLMETYQQDAIKLQKLHSELLDAVEQTFPVILKAGDKNSETILRNISFKLSKDFDTMLSQREGGRGMRLLESHCNVTYKQPRTVTSDVDEFHHFCFNPEELPDGEYPAWEEWFEKFVCPEETKEVTELWLGSTFSDFEGCRQALWIQGGGNDGKSIILKIITSFMGNAAHPLGSLGEFFGVGLESARLVHYDDCKNTKLLLNTKVKKLTGSPEIKINPKGSPEYTVKGDWRLLVTSNYLPEVDLADVAQASRLILIRVDKKKNDAREHFDEDGNVLQDGQFEEDLRDQFPGFLKQCIQKFNNVIVNHPRKIKDIPIPKALRNTYNNVLGLPQSEHVRDFIEERLIFTRNEEDFTRVKDMDLELKNYWKEESLNSKDIHFPSQQLREELSNEGFERSRKRTDGRRPYGYYGILLGSQLKDVKKKVDKDLFQDDEEVQI